MDAENWVLEPFVAERILLLLHNRSATTYVWTHVMICVEANIPPVSVRVRSAYVWTYHKSVPRAVWGFSGARKVGSLVGLGKYGYKVSGCGSRKKSITRRTLVWTTKDWRGDGLCGQLWRGVGAGWKGRDRATWGEGAGTQGRWGAGLAPRARGRAR